METRLDRTGVDATANNIIRTARPTARFFPQTASRRFDFFSQISSIRNEGRHEGGTSKRELGEKISHGFANYRTRRENGTAHELLSGLWR